MLRAPRSAGFSARLGRHYHRSLHTTTYAFDYLHARFMPMTLMPSCSRTTAYLTQRASRREARRAVFLAHLSRTAFASSLHDQSEMLLTLE